jgi:hypothetical protein
VYNQRGYCGQGALMNWFYVKRYALNIILLLAGVGVVILYTICGEACTYLQGGLFGIDLQYLGIAYVVVLIMFNILKQDSVILTLLSAGIGVEFFLVGYQIVHNTYCPYCLVFAAIIVVQFLYNMDVSKKLLILIFMALGFFVFFIFFKGSVFPVYSGVTIPSVSSFMDWNGSCRLIV